MHGTYVGRGRMLVRTDFGAKLLVSADDLSLMPSLVCDAGYDAPFTAYLQRELREGSVAVDVGANVGLFTLLMAWQVGPTGAVVAYEPDAANLALLRDSVSMNYVDGWTQVRGAAVGSDTVEALLTRSPSFHGDHSLVPFDEDYRRAHAIAEIEAVVVPVVTLDELVGRYERIALVKVDVEGYEAEVLRGARQLIASGVVRRFSLEVNRPRAGDIWQPLVDELRALGSAGWTFALIDEDGTAQATDLQPVLDAGRAAQLLVERL